MNGSGRQATVRQIRAFVAVADAGSYRGAADRLNTSQPTLTNQVASLEDAIGLRLFDEPDSVAAQLTRMIQRPGVSPGNASSIVVRSAPKTVEAYFVANGLPVR